MHGSNDYQSVIDSRRDSIEGFLLFANGLDSCVAPRVAAMKLALAGASGLVGGEVAAQAAERGYVLQFVGRRSLGASDREILTDFRKPVSLGEADAAICTLGTTIASAGSREAFRGVDHDAVLTFAESARASGIEHFLMVTAVGANPRAGVFYSRVKGEVERDVQNLGFRRVDIAQPGLLLGQREERRPVEAFLQAANPLLQHLMLGPMDRYAGISAVTVAAALLRLCETAREPGTYRHENRALTASANAG